MDRSVWLLTTARLALRRFTREDLAWLVELHSDRAVTRHLSIDANRDDARELLETRILQYYDEHPGLGIWVTVDRATGDRIGYHLLNHIRGESIIQVGYVLRQAAWGHGYATEMARALLRYGFVDRELASIAAMTSLDNTASQRVLLKIGLHRRGERTLAHPAYAPLCPLAWFERDAASWLAEHGADHSQSTRPRST